MAFTVFVGDGTGIVTRGRGRLLTPARLTDLAGRRTTVLTWRPNPIASFYNVQLFRVRTVKGTIVRRKLVSTFPRRPTQTIPGRLLRRGTYHLVVWSGLQSGPRTSYADKPWIVVVLKVARAEGSRRADGWRGRRSRSSEPRHGPAPGGGSRPRRTRGAAGQHQHRERRRHEHPERPRQRRRAGEEADQRRAEQEPDRAG